MPQTTSRLTVWAAFLVITGIAALRPAFAENYRIDTEIKIEGEKETYETLTIFRDGAVYDIPRQSPEITIFDPSHSQFILLDTEREIRSDFQFADLSDYFKRWQERIKETRNGKHPLFDPHLTLNWEEKGRIFSLEQSAVIKYRVTATPAPSAAVARQYRLFTDQMARLTIFRPDSVPPLARLEVNRVLDETAMLPEEIVRTIPAQSRLDKPQIVTATHNILWSLSTTDIKRVEEIGVQLSKFKQVTPQEYWKIPTDKAAPN